MSNLVPASEFNKEQLDLIKSTVAKGATDDELKLFLYRCKNMGLDPLKPGQVHFVKYGSNPGSIIVGIDGIRAKAARTGKFSGIKRGVIMDDGKCVAGWCEVYRSDWQHPAREEVPMSEYNTGKAQWASKPQTMIKKVAEAAALRMAFPDDLGGIYSEEEGIGQETIKDVRAKELTAQIQQTTEVPEFEASEVFMGVDPALYPEEEGPGEYVTKVGKNKGKKIKDLKPSELEAFTNWFDKEVAAGNTPHADVQEYYEMIHQFIAPFNEGPKDE